MNPKERRIAIFVPTLQFGGAERVAINLVSGFHSRGFAIDVLVVDEGGVFRNQIPQGTRLIRLGNRKRVLWALPHLVRYMRREEPWCVVSVMDHANVVAIWARILARRSRVVATVHCLPSQEAKRAKRLREKLSPYAMTLFMRRADEIVAVSNGIADDLVSAIGLERDRISVIPNPVLTPQFREQLKQNIEHPWLMPGEPPVIISVGRLTPSKDFPLLIRAFARVRKERSCRLLILGEGVERGTLERLVSELNLTADVALPGYTEAPAAFIARSSLFVLSSAWEGFGNVLIEALAAGKPIVATDCETGPREILQNGRYGHLVPVGNVEALAEGMLIALDSPRKPPPEEVLKRFELEFTIDAYLAIMEKGSHSVRSSLMQELT